MTEAPINHQKSVKGVNVQENNGKSKASHGTYFDEGRDVTPRHTSSEAGGTRVQESVPAGVTTGSCSNLCPRAPEPEPSHLLKSVLSQANCC